MNTFIHPIPFDLIINCKNNNRASQKQLYFLLAPELYSICNCYCYRDESDVILALGFVNILNQLDTYSLSEPFRAWAANIVMETIKSAYPSRVELTAPSLLFNL